MKKEQNCSRIFSAVSVLFFCFQVHHGKGLLLILVIELVEPPSVMFLQLHFCIMYLMSFSWYAFSGHVDDIYPYFLRHAKQIFPMLDCMDDLRKISDLRVPANWYASVSQ